MTQWLKQSTAVTLKLGPFVDDEDGFTALTALTISQSDVRLSKNGGNIAQKNESTAATHDELGYYDVPIDTTDTNTLGRLLVAVSETGALPVWQEFMIVPANVWDSLFGADKLQVHADEITAGLITAAAIATDAIDNDAIAANAVTEIQAGLLTSSAADTYFDDVAAAISDQVDNYLTPIKAKTDNLPADPASASTIEDSFADLNDIAVSDIIAATIEGSLDLQEVLRILLAALAGKSSGGGTTSIAFRDVADSKNRIAATVDGDGNRSAITLDAS